MTFFYCSNTGGGDTQRTVTYMNFEVFCFDWVGESLEVIQKEYFDTYAQALTFENTDGKQYESVSITPMNAAAEREMR